MTACKEALGPKKYHHKNWISEETLGRIRARKEKRQLSTPTEQEPRGPRHRKNTQMLTKTSRRASEQIKGNT